MKYFSAASFVGDVRNKIESKKFNIKNKTGIRIIITDVERKVGELPSPRSLQLLFRHFEQLQKVNSDFEEFLHMIKNDLKEKSNEISRQRTSDSSSKSYTSYAVIQLYILQQYEKRLDRFDFLTKQSLFKLSQKFLNGEEIDEKVLEHINIILKMKRRMKGFLDVSEKYLVLDVNDSVCQMNELCEDLEENSSNSRGVSCKKLSMSMLGLNNLFESKVSPAGRSGRSRSLSDRGTGNVERKTFKSVTDHLLIISKSFTSRL